MDNHDEKVLQVFEMFLVLIICECLGILGAMELFNSIWLVLPVGLIFGAVITIPVFKIIIWVLEKFKR